MCASYSFLHRGSAEFLRRSMRIICICFQKVTRFVICRPACPDFPQNRIEVFAGRGRPDQFFRNFVETDCNVFTKVVVRSCGEVPTHLGSDKVLVQPKFTCFRQMLRINQEKPLFQLRRDFRTSKFFAASAIGGSSKIAKISIIQVLEGLF